MDSDPPPAWWRGFRLLCRLAVSASGSVRQAEVVVVERCQLYSREGALVESCICIRSKVNGNTAKAGCTSFLVKCVGHVAFLEYAMLSHRRI